MVVRDLEAAKAQLTEAVGYRWDETRTYELPIRLFDGVRTLTLRYAYSLETPYVELVEEIPGTPWVAAPPLVATHHIGYLCDDLAAASEWLERAGYALEACAEVEGAMALFAYHLSASGVRIEIVDRSIFQPPS
ncbi:VOC family protein [Nocardia sp. XZ_19_231]|uniref:VOC family protein n=1 Tax=Nocardia sp. XZ_19_231 TaxID=2769252 RepID=UPI001E549912|nr:VOC family protein [Nocardia sp. XZ_19_231]